MEVNSNSSSKRATVDKKLVEQVLQNNKEAFADLMDYYYEAIFYMLLKMTSNKNDASDLTSVVFEKAYKNIHQYSTEFAFSTWLFRIATNACIDHYRKTKQQTISIDDDDFTQSDLQSSLKDLKPGPEDALINKQKAIELRQMLEHLKPAYKNLLELRFFKEYSYEEIAKHLDLPIGTVKTQLHRAKGQLLKLYTQQSNDND